MYLHYLLVYR